MNKEYISAGEVNKYCYCPKQWYYTRVFGEKELRARYKELYPERTGQNQSFARGRDFHEKYAGREKTRRVLRWMIVLVTMCIIVCIVWLLKR